MRTCQRNEKMDNGVTIVEEGPGEGRRVSKGRKKKGGIKKKKKRGGAT